MRGHAQLEAMRRSGYAPAWVDVCLYPVKPHLLGVSDSGLIATIEATSWDHARADLRCVVGLEVRVSGDDATAVHAMRDACIKAGASRVIATVFDGREDIPDAQRFAALKVTDTKGILTWPN